MLANSSETWKICRKSGHIVSILRNTRSAVVLQYFSSKWRRIERMIDRTNNKCILKKPMFDKKKFSIKTLTEKFKPLILQSYGFENPRNSKTNWIFFAFTVYTDPNLRNKIGNCSIKESSYFITLSIETLMEELKMHISGRTLYKVKICP